MNTNCAHWLPPLKQNTRKGLRTIILNLLQFGDYSQEEIITYFDYSHWGNTIKNELRLLELENKISYNPRTRIYKLK